MKESIEESGVKIKINKEIDYLINNEYIHTNDYNIS